MFYSGRHRVATYPKSVNKTCLSLVSYQGCSLEGESSHIMMGDWGSFLLSSKVIIF
jgi:hypothetical protein